MPSPAAAKSVRVPSWTGACERVRIATVCSTADRTAAAYRRYRRELAWFYDQERRFAGAPFWLGRATR